jgi:Tol biopolymer transport system component
LFGVLGLVAYWWVNGKTDSTAAAFQKTQISRLTTDGKALFPAMSPDGKYVAFVSGEIGNRGLLVQQVATNSSVTLVPHSPLGFKAINFSPDGNYVYYTQTSPDYTLNTLYQIPTLGGTPKKLIEDVDSPVSFSPDAKRLTFMRQNSKDETDQIFTANSDGSNLQLLTETRTTGFNKFTAPAWSPDGTKMMVGAIKNPGDNNAEVVLMEISAIDGSLEAFSEKKWDSIDSISWFKDGSGFLMTARELESAATQILRVAYPSGEIQPITNDLNNYFGLAISSDGGTLVTVQGNAVAAIWNYNPETKEQNQLMPENPGLDGDWGISQAPDGKVVFTRKNGRECNLWEVDLDGKNAHQLTSESRINNNPLVTHDGRYILFVSNRSGSWRIWRMERDGKNPVQLSQGAENNGDFNPEIMPDSKTVIFQRNNTGSSRGAIMKISIDGGEITTLLSDNRLSYDLSSISPDGKRVVFREFNPASYEKKIVIGSLDGNSLQIEKTIPPDFVSLIYWSPDSKSLTYSSGEGIVNIWRMLLDGTARKPLTDFKAGRIHSFSWSNDGKNLFISRGIYNNDLVLIRDTAKASK